MVKKFFFFSITFVIILLLSEIIFTSFFYLKSDFSGPILRLFLKENKTTEDMIMENVKIDTKTNKMVPGKYLIKGLEYSINSKGFRGDEFSNENKNNCRVISLGGSITLGVEKSYPEILGNTLKKKNKNCESLNFGMGSKGLNYIEDLFLNEVIGYEPNIITIMANRNSTMYDSYGSGSKSPGIITSKSDYLIYRANKFLYSNLMTFRFLDLSTKRMIFIMAKDSSKIVNPANESLLHSKNYFDNKYFSQLVNIAEASDKNGIKLVLIKEPYYLDLELQNKLKLLDKENLIKKLVNYQNEDYNNKNILFWAYTNAILNAVLDEVSEKYNNVAVVDPTALLYSANKEKNFLDDGNHLTNEGHRIVAEEVFEEIKKYF